MGGRGGREKGIALAQTTGNGHEETFNALTDGHRTRSRGRGSSQHQTKTFATWVRKKNLENNRAGIKVCCQSLKFNSISLGYKIVCFRRRSQANSNSFDARNDTYG